MSNATMNGLAFIFPGQGSQNIGMGKIFYDNFPIARQVFQEADDSLHFGLSTLCFQGPEDALKLTENTQPAILTTSVAALRVVRSETGLEAELAAGHSLGEYSALVAAGALAFPDAVKIVRLRGRFMQEAVPVGEGAMAAVLGLERKDVEALCEEVSAGEVLSPANFNCPGQIAIAGHSKAVQRAIEKIKEMGKKAVLLPVSAPFHSPLMKAAGVRLEKELEPIPVGELKIPVITNVEAQFNTSKDRVKELLVAQVSSPVRWEESMRAMIDHGIERVLEIGPGKVLSGLMKRIDAKIKMANVEDADTLKKVDSFMKN
jgi:[acyl-carrier-protein] S-malonyltransferase